jgi:hypothetical protein
MVDMCKLKSFLKTFKLNGELSLVYNDRLTTLLVDFL